MNESSEILALRKRLEDAEGLRELEMLRTKACEAIADGDEGHEEIEENCPAVQSVRVLRNRLDVATDERDRAVKVAEDGERYRSFLIDIARHLDLLGTDIKDLPAAVADRLKRRPWPVLKCPDCDGVGSTGTAPSGKKYSCETCGGNEDSDGRGWVDVVTREELDEDKEQYDILEDDFWKTVHERDAERKALEDAEEALEVMTRSRDGWEHDAMNYARSRQCQETMTDAARRDIEELQDSLSELLAYLGDAHVIQRAKRLAKTIAPGSGEGVTRKALKAAERAVEIYQHGGVCGGCGHEHQHDKDHACDHSEKHEEMHSAMATLSIELDALDPKTPTAKLRAIAPSPSSDAVECRACADEKSLGTMIAEWAHTNECFRTRQLARHKSDTGEEGQEELLESLHKSLCLRCGSHLCPICKCATRADRETKCACRCHASMAAKKESYSLAMTLVEEALRERWPDAMVVSEKDADIATMLEEPVIHLCFLPGESMSKAHEAAIMATMDREKEIGDIIFMAHSVEATLEHFPKLERPGCPKHGKQWWVTSHETGERVWICQRCKDESEEWDKAWSYFTCTECGSDVQTVGSSQTDPPADYAWRCSNPECLHHAQPEHTWDQDHPAWALAKTDEDESNG